jgi:hypothetical protein
MIDGGIRQDEAVMRDLSPDPRVDCASEDKALGLT